MPSPAQDELRIAKHYIDTIGTDALSKVDKLGNDPVLAHIGAEDVTKGQGMRIKRLCRRHLLRI
jgi:hypothetical protein